MPLAILHQESQKEFLPLMSRRKYIIRHFPSKLVTTLSHDINKLPSSTTSGAQQSRGNISGLIIYIENRNICILFQWVAGENM